MFNTFDDSAAVYSHRILIYWHLCHGGCRQVLCRQPDFSLIWQYLSVIARYCINKKYNTVHIFSVLVFSSQLHMCRLYFLLPALVLDAQPTFLLMAYMWYVAPM